MDEITVTAVKTGWLSWLRQEFQPGMLFTQPTKIMQPSVALIFLPDNEHLLSRGLIRKVYIHLYSVLSDMQSICHQLLHSFTNGFNTCQEVRETL